MNVNFLKWKSENWKNDTKFCVFSSFHFHIRLSQMNLNIFDFHSRPAVAHILLPFVSRLSASAGCEVNVLPPTQLNGPDSKRLHLPPLSGSPRYCGEFFPGSESVVADGREWEAICPTA